MRYDGYVRMVIFLLPHVPGIPIYLTFGIMIIPVGRAQFGVIGSIFYGVGDEV